MSTCEDLAIKSGLMKIYEDHFAALKDMDYLDLAKKMEEMRPTDADGAKLKELEEKRGEAKKAYHATFTPLFEKKKELRAIVHAWPEYLAVSQEYEKARDACDNAYEQYWKKEEDYRVACNEFSLREKFANEGHGGAEFARPMWMFHGNQELKKLKEECTALSEKKKAAEKAFTTYKERINYHYIARGTLEAMNDFN